jgi:hypothetical protein
MYVLPDRSTPYDTVLLPSQETIIAVLVPLWWRAACLKEQTGEHLSKSPTLMAQERVQLRRVKVLTPSEFFYQMNRDFFYFLLWRNPVFKG